MSWKWIGTIFLFKNVLLSFSKYGASLILASEAWVQKKLILFEKKRILRSDNERLYLKEWKIAAILRTQYTRLSLFTALQHAGKHMEDCIVASYTALLLGCLCQESPVRE